MSFQHTISPFHTISDTFYKNIPLISFLFQNNFLLLQMFHADNASQGVLDGWDDILEKAFAKRFDFDCVELRNL